MNYENIARYFIRGTVGTPSYWPAIHIDRIKESGHRLFSLVKNCTACLKFHLPFSSSFFFPFFITDETSCISRLRQSAQQGISKEISISKILQKSKHEASMQFLTNTHNAKGEKEEEGSLSAF